MPSKKSNCTLGGGIPHAGHLEKGPDPGPIPLQASDIRADGLGKVLAGGDQGPAHGLVRQIGPHPFIRIQLRRIRQQEKQAEPAFDPCQELLHFPCPVGRVHIDNQKNGAGGPTEEPVEEGTEFGGIHSSGNQHKAHLATGTDGGNHVEVEAGVCRVDDRRVVVMYELKTLPQQEESTIEERKPEEIPLLEMKEK